MPAKTRASLIMHRPQWESSLCILILLYFFPFWETHHIDQDFAYIYITCARKHTRVHLSSLILFSIYIFYIYFFCRAHWACSVCVGVGISRRNYILLLLITMTKITRLAWALCSHAPFGAVFVWATGFCCGSRWETLSTYDILTCMLICKPLLCLPSSIIYRLSLIHTEGCSSLAIACYISVISFTG